ncbi:MAG: AIPR family protein [Variovorax sp.]|nr:AIPR family protein [Variovorax sp.]
MSFIHAPFQGFGDILSPAWRKRHVHHARPEDLRNENLNMAGNLVLSYPDILKNFGPHLVQGRTESRAFLGWFLEHYFRLDETDAQDSICDGPDDKGVDGIYVDGNLERIDVFQTKLYQNDKRTLGDTALKEFAGTLDQLRTRESIEHLASTTGNVELRELIKDTGLATLVEKGYKMRGVFVTNSTADKNAAAYIQSRSDITVFDGEALEKIWVPPGESAPVHTEMKFRLDGHTAIQYKTPDATVFVAPLLATELVALTGLQSGELFAWNVRQALGRTKVNKAIADSVAEQAEHKNFLLYHNGLTILAEKAAHVDDHLLIDGYTVVNGCQSLTTLFEHRAKITDELRLLARIIMLPPQNELAAKITRHSNNQNSISARDLQSNSTIQRRLQAEFRSVLSGQYDYEIKRGETSNGAKIVITNEEAARLLLAFDREQPWSCHQSYRLFDDLHSEIFGRPEVTAMRIAALHVLFTAVIDSLSEIKDQLVANYRLTHYFLLYLLRQAIAVDPAGRDFIERPDSLVQSVGLEKLLGLAKNILADLIVDFNAEIAERIEAKNPFDHKRELKSPTAVRTLAKQLIPSYEKAIRRDRATSFSSELAKISAGAG